MKWVGLSHEWYLMKILYDFKNPNFFYVLSGPETKNSQPPNIEAMKILNNATK